MTVSLITHDKQITWTWMKVVNYKKKLSFVIFPSGFISQVVSHRGGLIKQGPLCVLYRLNSQAICQLLICYYLPAHQRPGMGDIETPVRPSVCPSVRHYSFSH